MALSRLNISVKMNVVVIGCLVAFLMLPSLLLVENMFENLRKNIERNNQYTAKLASEIYFHPLLENDFAAIMSLTLGFLQDENIIQVAVYNAKGINVVPLSQKEIANPATQHEYRQMITIGGGTTNEGLPIGEVVITFNMEKHYQEVQHAQGIFLSLIATIIVLTIALISFLLRRFIKVPIDELIQTVAKIKRGNLNHKAKVIAHDEIGELATVFNKMTCHLEEVETELIDAKSLAEQALEKNLKAQQHLIHSEKMASLGTLTAGVAHEINNPTHFVYVSAQMMQNDLTCFSQYLYELLGSDPEPEIKLQFKQQLGPLHNHVGIIIDGTERIKTIVQGLRTFTQLDAADKKTINIVHCLHSTIKLVQTKHLEQVDFITHFDKIPDLLCYPAQLNQVFMNLIINACDAIRDKQKFEASNAKGQIILGCNHIGTDIQITIADDGCGMNEETKNKLFEPFYTTKAIGEGTGLGLSISYGIIKKHQGQLSVRSEAGIGTCFTLLLPLNI